MKQTFTITYGQDTPTTQFIRVSDADNIVFKPEKVNNLKKATISETINDKLINVYQSPAPTFTYNYQCNKNNSSAFETTIQFKIVSIYIINSSYFTYINTINVTIYTSSVINSFETLHLLQTQFIDDKDNHLFCVFESEDGNILLNTIKQTANRVVLYEQQQLAKMIPVFTNYINDDIFTVKTSPEFSTDEILIANDDVVIFVPLSAQVKVVSSSAKPSNDTSNTIPKMIDWMNYCIASSFELLDKTDQLTFKEL